MHNKYVYNECTEKIKFTFLYIPLISLIVLLLSNRKIYERTSLDRIKQMQSSLEV